MPQPTVLRGFYPKWGSDAIPHSPAIRRIESSGSGPMDVPNALVAAPPPSSLSPSGPEEYNLTSHACLLSLPLLLYQDRQGPRGARPSARLTDYQASADVE